MVASIALYYPSSHFRDDQWLKVALLTWDTVTLPVYARQVSPVVTVTWYVRFVTKQISLSISPQTKLIWNTYPSGTFLNLLRTYQPQLSATYAPIGHWLGAPAERHSTSGPARRSATSESGLTWIYVGGRGSKVALPQARQLIDTGLAVTQPDHHYLGFHPKLGAERSIWQC